MPCCPAGASQVAACSACGAASAPTCARPAWPSSAPGTQVPFTCPSARSTPVGPAPPASAAAAAGPGAALAGSGGAALGPAGRAGPSTSRLASRAGTAAAGRPGAGAGAAASRRARCSWKAGVTQAPLQLCAPAQLNAPRRAPHLRAARALQRRGCSAAPAPARWQRQHFRHRARKARQRARSGRQGCNIPALCQCSMPMHATHGKLSCHIRMAGSHAGMRALHS